MDQLRRRKWSWLGHTLRRSDDCIARQALQWTGHHKAIEEERVSQGTPVKEIEMVVQDRDGWRWGSLWSYVPLGVVKLKSSSQVTFCIETLNIVNFMML